MPYDEETTKFLEKELDKDIIDYFGKHRYDLKYPMMLQLIRNLKELLETVNDLDRRY